MALRTTVRTITLTRIANGTIRIFRKVCEAIVRTIARGHSLALPARVSGLYWKFGQWYLICHFGGVEHPGGDPKMPQFGWRQKYGAFEKGGQINEEIQPKISIPINTKKIKDIKSKKKTEQLNKTEKKKFEVTKYQAKSSFNITKFLSYILVSIITFVALIILIDTFKSVLYVVFPGLELIIFSLFETLKDIQLFIKDLI